MLKKKNETAKAGGGMKQEIKQRIQGLASFWKKPVAAASESENTQVGKQGRKEDAVTESLKVIYEGKPSAESFKTFDQSKRKTWIIVLIVSALFIVLTSSVAWLGFWWFGGRGFTGSGLAIQIEGPNKVNVGEEQTYFINWHNNTNEPLASTEFRVSFPNDFIITTTDPIPSSEPLVFRLGAQSAEGRGTIKVTGAFTGALGTKSAIQVIATYRPASFNSDFEQLSTKEVEYTGTVLEGSLELPKKVLPGDEVNLLYRIKNTGKEDMNGLIARIELPEGFALASTGSQAEIDGQRYTKEIGTLAKGAEILIEIKGSFSLGSSGDIVMKAEVGRIGFDGVFAAALRSENTISVLAGDLSIDLLVNGSANDRSVTLGEDQRIAISYQNVSGEELHDVTMIFIFEPEEEGAETFVDWDALVDENKGVVETNQVKFTSEQIAQFENFPADGEGIIELSVPIVDALEGKKDIPLRATVMATIGKVDDVVVNRSLETKPITMKLRSDASVTAISRYTAEEGVAVGSGPLPPLVGSGTTYRIEWRIEKTIHRLEHVQMSANLPNNVSFAGAKEVEAGELGYDADLRLVRWSINAIPEDVGSILVSFDVTLTPAEADAGRFAKLLGETRFEFTDTTLAEPILRTAPAITTDLPDDTLAKGKGVVDKP